MLPRRPIQTERLVLRPASVADAPELVAAIDASREHLGVYLPWARHNRFEDTLGVLYRMEQAWEADAAFHFTLVRDGARIGGISLRRNPDQGGEANVGYWVAAAHAGQGVVTEALGALLEFSFHSAGLARVELRAHVDNLPSQRVAEKVGMAREGRLRGALLMPPGVPEDAYLFGILASDPRGAARAASVAVSAPTAGSPDFSRGLVTAVVQDEADGTVLMVAHMDEEAYLRTRLTGHAWFWSRSRQRLWEKGETSGNFMVVSSVSLDCDGDAVLVRVAPAGPACHTGERTCFHNPV